MQIQIERLEEKRIDTVDLADVGLVYPEHDVIYFGATPYRISSATPKIPPCCCYERMGDNDQCKIHPYMGGAL